MKRIYRIGVVGALLLQPVRFLWASGPGSTAADILNIPVGARAIGMGEASVAQSDDVHSLYWNPAGLALMQQREASFMYSQMIQDSSYQNASVGIPLENGAVGGSLSYLNYGSIPGYSQTNTPIGDQTAYSGVATVGGAWLGNLWSAGGNLKGIREKLADESATGVAVDLGANVIYPKPVLGGTIRFGAVYQNLGPSIKFEQQKDNLPSTWKIGIAALQMVDQKLNLSMDIGKPKFDDTFISGGAEYWFTQFLALRLGYTNNHTEGAGIRTGLGLRIKGITFDYAYAGQGELGINNRFELGFHFGEPRPILTPEERKILNQAKAAMSEERYEQAVLLFDSLINLEPHYQPARRLIKVAISKLEGQQQEMLSKQGHSFNPDTAQTTKQPSLPDMDDLEQLLNMSTPKSTTPTKGSTPNPNAAPTNPGTQPQGVDNP